MPGFIKNSVHTLTDKFLILAQKLNRKEIIIKDYPEISDKINLIYEIDPSPTKKYVLWIAKALSQNNSVSDVKKAIDLFDKHSHKFRSNDIYQYNFADLLDEIDNIIPNQSYLESEQFRNLAKDYKVIYGDDNIKVIKPNSTESCIDLGSSSWCVSKIGNESFDNYISNGDLLYIVIFGKDKLACRIVENKKYGEDEFIWFDKSNNEVKESYVSSVLGDKFNDVFDAINNDIMKNSR